MGFMRSWAEYERFKAGDQWPSVTEATKNFPRPVFNIHEYIIGHKVSAVMNENVKMVFSPEEVPNEGEEEIADKDIQRAVDGADKYTKLSDSTYEQLGQEEINEEVLDSAATLGIGISHYYWDTSIEGGITTPYIGNIAGEEIDPVNIFFGNPQCRKAQKQPYIIISYRELVETVKEEARNNKVALEYIEQITGDKNTQDENYDMAQREVDDQNKSTVLCKYYKKGKTIWVKKTCCGVTIKPDTDTRMKLYPIAVMTWKKRKKSIYGTSESQGIIPNQKLINLMLAMMAASSQNMAYPKLIVKENALQQAVTNAIGEILIDHSPQGIIGIKTLEGSTFDPLVMNLVEKFIDYTKTLNGASETSTGDFSRQEMNATAIMLLQKAAGVPIESIKKRFYRYLEDVGRIWAEFYRVYFNTERAIKVKNDEGKDEMFSFNGEDYNDIPMNLKLDIGPSSSYSETLMMTSLDKLYDKGVLTDEDYLEFAPRNVVPFKDRLLKRLKERQEMLAELEREMLNNPGINQGVNLGEEAPTDGIPMERAPMPQVPQI